MSSSSSLYNRLQTSRHEHDRLQQEVQRRQTTLQATRQRMSHTLQQIRTVVIEAIRAGEQFDWTDTDEQVSTLFKQLYDRHDTLTSQLTKDEAEAQRANEAVRQALAAHEAAAQALTHLDQHIDSATEALAEVQLLRQQQDDIEVLTERLGNQKADAEAEATSKRQAYEADRYFRYLWQRGYAAPQYTGGGISQRLDRWLADASYFHDNRRQYELLLAIPERLQAAIAESTEQLASLDAEIARHREQIAGQMQRPLAQANADAAASAVTAAKAAVAEIVSRMQGSKTEVGSISDGVHDLHQRMARLVDSALDNQQLKRFVGSTLSNVDDTLLRQYEQDARQVQQLQAESAQLSARAQAAMLEIDELNSAYNRAKLLEVAVIAATAARRSNRSGGGMWGGGGFGGGGFGGGGFSGGGGFGGGGFKTGGGF